MRNRNSFLTVLATLSLLTPLAALNTSAKSQPSSLRLKEEQALLQGEAATPTSVSRINASSPLYPRR